MKILITGVPGTGKTKLAAVLCKRLDWPVLAINDIATKYIIKKGAFGSKIVNIKKTETCLNKLLNKQNNVIVEGHLGCDMKLNVDMVIVLRCTPAVLKKRLKKRNYEKQKITENVEAELIDYCSDNTEKNYKKAKIIEFNSSKKSIKEIVKDIVKKIEEYCT